MNTLSPPDIRNSAERSFSQGLYCAESVAVSLARAQGVDSELVSRIATAFCSGMGRTRGTCGALTGAVMGVSLALGRTQPGESVRPSYEATQRLVRQFEQEFGARECHVLLGCDIGTPEGQAEFRAKGLGERCARYTGRAAEIAAQFLNEAAGHQRAAE
jgi:C_GCAxxG_C_C family probable redox protein